MKKISLLLILYLITILFLFAACEKTCGIKRPKDVKPIDWENYNDVYTVFWNLTLSDIDKFPLHEEVMVYGWIYNQYHDGISAKSFTLVDDKNGILDAPEYPQINISGFNELQGMFDTCALTKKCFVKGILLFNHIKYMGCSRLEIKMEITDINDIYFK
jgi:hypothetical protein